MTIDWFTFIAQIVNFLVLIWLLNRFLYGPIVKAMDEREATIAGRLEEAARKQQDADREAASYRARQESLERQRGEYLDQAREDAEARRRTLLQAALDDVEKAQTEWREAMRRERETYLADLRKRIGTQVLETARRVLHDLADVGLEAQIVRVFTDRLRALDDEGRSRLAGAEAPVVRTAFDLAPEQREAVTDVLRHLIGPETTPRFKTEPDMQAGIELKTGDWKLAWSLESLLETLEERLAAALDQSGEPPSARAQPAPNRAPVSLPTPNRQPV